MKKKHQEEMYKKYNLDNIFNRKTKNDEDEKDASLAENMQLSIVEETKWYKKYLKR